MIINCKSTKQFVNRSEISTMYFNDIRKYPVLTVSEERELLYTVKTGNPQQAEAARQKIIECNQRFVVSVAKKWQNGDNLMDIVNEGNVGLIRAIDNFDINKKQRFLTYAVFWIRKAINEYIINNDNVVKPKNANKIYTYANKARNSFFMKNERNPSLDELKEELETVYNVHVYDKEDLAQFIVATIDDKRSGEKFDNECGSINICKEFDDATASNNVEEDINRQHCITTARRLLTCLDERERQIIEMSFGIGGGCENTLDTIATEMKLSKERVRQLYAIAIKKMSFNSRNIDN